MQILAVKISEADRKRFQLDGDEIQFKELVEKISLEYAKESLLRCQDIAAETGLSEMSLAEINAEISAARNAKGNS